MKSAITGGPYCILVGPIYGVYKTYILDFFSNNIWSYLLWSPVIDRRDEKKIDGCDMEEFGTLLIDRTEKTIAIPGDEVVATGGETGTGED